MAAHTLAAIASPTEQASDRGMRRPSKVPCTTYADAAFWILSDRDRNGVIGDDRALILGTQIQNPAEAVDTEARGKLDVV